MAKTDKDCPVLGRFFIEKTVKGDNICPGQMNWTWLITDGS